jgi:hypothetical protein
VKSCCLEEEKGKEKKTNASPLCYQNYTTNLNSYLPTWYLLRAQKDRDREIRILGDHWSPTKDEARNPSTVKLVCCAARQQWK